MISRTNLRRSIVTHTQVREDAQRFGLKLCQLTLIRIPCQIPRARLEFLEEGEKWQRAEILIQSEMTEE